MRRATAALPPGVAVWSCESFRGMVRPLCLKPGHHPRAENHAPHVPHFGQEIAFTLCQTVASASSMSRTGESGQFAGGRDAAGLREQRIGAATVRRNVLLPAILSR